ncbi:hypothetical protein [Novosphingobium sp. 9]|uniref:hypothetical protein n=1 Tax=Novosphingobium sp. 9 TaxID=2025349 RepID=UPI0021B64C57|nr:hypothetical protein [Novosphingobium sp. 9]
MTSPISTPARYTPAFAVGFSDTGGDFSLVHAAQPLPVTMAASAPAAALSSTAAANAIAGPYIPVAGRTVMISLSGTWSGTVRLLRSIDGGATKVPVTVGGSAWGSSPAMRASRYGQKKRTA